MRIKIDFFVHKNISNLNLSKMIAFPEITNLSVFPYPEGYQFEFKETATKQCVAKLDETICGFLNNEGGYFIVGVHDDRRILGINPNKDYDLFLLRVDQLYHSKTIVHEDGSQISVGTIKIFTVPTKNNKIICVVQVTPEPNQKYRMGNGEAFYRLSASNYRLSNANNLVTLRKSDIETMVFNKTLTIQQDFKKLVRRSKELDMTNKKLVAEVTGLNNKKSLLEKKEKKATQMLFDLILKQKKEKEEELYGKVDELKKPVKGDIDSLGLCCLLL
jgi:predicted HTH transcriptional regulator